MNPNVRDGIEEHFWGYAQMSIADIDFPHDAKDEVGINRIIESFQAQGCHHDLSTYAAVIMMDRKACMNNPMIHFDPDSSSIGRIILDPDIRVLCLHGKLRMLAAKRFLPLADQWWTVRVFDSGKTLTLVRP